MDLVKALSSQYMKEELPEMRVGDTVRVQITAFARSPPIKPVKKSAFKDG